MSQVHSPIIKFIETLAQDRHEEVRQEKKKASSPYGPGNKGWQNTNIESYLEAVADWGTQSINGLSVYSKPNNPWTRCAQMLLMGKIYE